MLPALVVAVFLGSTAQAAPAPSSPFSNKSYGEGGGYKHPDAAVGDFFETKPPEPADAKPQRPPAPAAKAVPEMLPVAARQNPSRPRPRPFAGVPSSIKAQERVTDAPGSSKAAPKAGFLAGSSAAAAEGSDDAASEDARRDYETKLFGAHDAPRHPGLADRADAPKPAAATAASTGEGMLFVSLELDPKEAGSLRDAVAGLGSAADFRADARFQPLPGEGGSVRISGWLPASRLGDVISRRGVRRVAVERGSRPAADDSVGGTYLVKLRVTDPAHPEESVARSVRDLSFAAGFKLERVFGVETVPGGGATALVSGTMPVARLSRALGMPGVIKVSSELSAAALAAEAPAAPARKEGFLKFVMARGLWLIVLTLLLALPVISDLVKKSLSVFVPYR